MICGDTPTYGWIYGCVDGWVNILTFDFLLIKPLQPVQDYFYVKTTQKIYVTQGKHREFHLG